MVYVTTLCTECVQTITNPICPNCFVQHVLYWLRDKNLSARQMGKTLKEFKELVIEAEESPSDIPCIVCNTPKVNLCTFCFINKATKILERSITGDKTLNEFNQDFETIIWRI